MASESGAEAKETVKLAPESVFVDEFDPEVKGVEPIRKGGTEVSADKVDEVKRAAQEAGRLYRVVEVE